MNKISTIIFLSFFLLSSCTPTQGNEPPSTPVIARDVLTPTNTVAPSNTPEALPSETATLAPTATINAQIVTQSAIAEFELATRIEGRLELIRNQFPLDFNRHFESYDFLCVFEEINFLDESEFITVGNDQITVTGDCSYLDLDRNKQTVTVALLIQNIANRTF